MTTDNHNRLPASDDDEDVVAYLANSLNDARAELERTMATITTALVIARLALQRGHDDG